MPGTSLKEERSDTHTNFVRQLDAAPAHILIHMDGSFAVAYRANQVIFRKQEALGKYVEVYDAEMWGLAAAGEAIHDYSTQLDMPNSMKHIHFYADHTGAIQRCFDGSVGKGPTILLGYPWGCPGDLGHAPLRRC